MKNSHLLTLLQMESRMKFCRSQEKTVLQHTGVDGDLFHNIIKHQRINM